MYKFFTVYSEASLDSLCFSKHSGLPLSGCYFLDFIEKQFYPQKVCCLVRMIREIRK